KMHFLLLALLPAIALGCRDFFDTWMDGRCFQMTYQPSILQSDAKLWCERDGAHLPSIKSEKENSDIFTAIVRYNNFDSRAFWLGLSCDGEKFVWADGSEANYTNFADDVKCTPSSAGRYYYVDGSRHWHETVSRRVSGVSTLLCEEAQRSASPCDNFDVLQSGNSSDICYKTKSGAATWQSALDNCKKEGGFLAVVHDEAANDFIRSTAVSKGFLDGIQIGIQRDSRGNYTWADGSAIDYNNFAAGFPNEAYGKCVAMHTGFLPGKWMNIDCYNTRLPYVCSKPAFSASNPQPDGCPVKYAPGEQMFSPSYPQAPGAGNCDYLLLESSPNKIATVEITFLEANSCCDTLTIYDGLFGSRVLKTITGYVNKPVTVRGSSNALRLRWNATSGANVRGFEAKMVKLY
ncbi:hypothetical protein PFISCL1PPCAC_28437, partial [Pristionchus fissidentatus]